MPALRRAAAKAPSLAAHNARRAGLRTKGESGAERVLGGLCFDTSNMCTGKERVKW